MRRIVLVVGELLCLAEVLFCLQEEIRSGATSPSGAGSTPATTPGTAKSDEEGQLGEEGEDTQESKGTSKKEVNFTCQSKS